MNKNGLKLVLFSSVLVLSIIFWGVFDSAVLSGGEAWTYAALFLLLLVANLFLNFAVFKSRYFLLISIALVVAIEFLFVFKAKQIIPIIFFISFIWIAALRIRDEMENHIRIDLFQSFRLGKSFLIVAFAFLIAGHFYFILAKNKFQGGSVPQIKISSFLGKSSAIALGMISDFYRDLEKNGTTVDELILSSGSSEFDMDELLMTSGDRDVTEKSSELVSLRREAVLLEGRKKLSESAMREVNGNEKAADVIIEISNNKVDEIFQPAMKEMEIEKYFPLLVAFAFFFGFLALGPIFGYLSIFAAMAVFYALKYFGVIKIEKKTIDVEVIK